MSGYFASYFADYFDAQSAPVTDTVTEQPTGGYRWRGWHSFGDYLARKYPQRKKLERAIEREIAALINDVPAKPAEEYAREYLAELREAIASAQAADAQFRAFMQRVQIEDTQRLESLLKLEQALRKEIRRRRDEEDHFLLSLLAA